MEFITDKIGEKVRVGDSILYSPFRSTRLQQDVVTGISPSGYPQIRNKYYNGWDHVNNKSILIERTVTVVNEFIKI